MTTTDTPHAALLPGMRVRVGEAYGQLQGFNRTTGLVTFWDEALAGQTVVTIDVDDPEALTPAPLVCASCSSTVARLFVDATDPAADVSPSLCADCSRSRARRVHRYATCDRCSADGAWRNPFTRRNEYMCASCHVASGDGVVQNKWAPRVSEPHSLGRRVVCELAVDVDSAMVCRGEIKPRTIEGNLVVACNAHVGKVSASEGLADREW